VILECRKGKFDSQGLFYIQQLSKRRW